MKVTLVLITMLFLPIFLFAQATDKIAQAKAIIVGTTPQIVLEGVVEFVENKAQTAVSMNLKMKGLKSLSQHAIHIHEKGSCDDAGSAAGGHWNPQNKIHGHLYASTKDAAKPAHKGDIGNLVVNEKGESTLHFTTEEWCISCKDESKNIINKAIIIHEAKDDFKTQPTGGAGARIGCGVIQIDLPESEK